MASSSSLLLAALATAGLLPTSLRALAPASTESTWVWTDASGRLLERTTARGDRIPDFSACGYQADLTPLPDAALLVTADRILTVAPVDGDDQASLQAAIDLVSGWPLQPTGFRGIVQLEPGEYQIAGQLRIVASGVIFRGTDTTVLRATGTTQRSLVRIGATSGRWLEVGNTRTAVTDPYVPVGATALNVASTAAFGKR
jgi:pectin methylesterase-like acyl-CoA thioesterase